MSVRILGLQVNLLNNRPLLGATKTGFLGLGRRRLQEAAGRPARRLLGSNTWRPRCVACPQQISVAMPTDDKSCKCSALRSWPGRCPPSC